MEYNIAIIGEQASGKTSCVCLLKDLPIEKRYCKTFGPEVHPINGLKNGGCITVWDMPAENYEKYMDKMHGIIYVTKKLTQPTIDLTMPHIVLNNRSYRMTSESAKKAYSQLADIITEGAYSAYIRRSRVSVAS